MHVKRLTIPMTWTRFRKTRKWATAPAPGPHKKFDSIPLSMLLRDTLGVVSNVREVKNALSRGMVKVDGKAVKERHRGVGLMDSVQIADQCYRVIPDLKGLKLITIPAKEAGLKLVKITGKSMVGGKLQLNLHDGRNILSDKKDMAIGDTLLISVPDNKISKHLPITAGAQVLITSGKHRGVIATLKDRKKMPFRADQAVVDAGKETFETTFDYLMAIGEVQVSQ